jgi:hypothetical protein
LFVRFAQLKPLYEQLIEKLFDLVGRPFMLITTIHY